MIPASILINQRMTTNAVCPQSEINKIKQNENNENNSRRRRARNIEMMSTFTLETMTTKNVCATAEAKKFIIWLLNWCPRMQANWIKGQVINILTSEQLHSMNEWTHHHKIQEKSQSTNYDNGILCVVFFSSSFNFSIQLDAKANSIKWHICIWISSESTLVSIYFRFVSIETK